MLDKSVDEYLLKNKEDVTSTSLKEEIREYFQIGYCGDYNVWNAFDCWMPQKMERVFLVGSTTHFHIKWPKKGKKYFDFFCGLWNWFFSFGVL